MVLAVPRAHLVSIQSYYSNMFSKDEAVKLYALKRRQALAKEKPFARRAKKKKPSTLDRFVGGKPAASGEEINTEMQDAVRIEAATDAEMRRSQSQSSDHRSPFAARGNQVECSSRAHTLAASFHLVTLHANTYADDTVCCSC